MTLSNEACLYSLSPPARGTQLKFKLQARTPCHGMYPPLLPFPHFAWAFFNDYELPNRYYSLNLNLSGKTMLDFIRDIYASFRQTSLERVKSPVLGAFVFSWLGFNWRMLAILFLSKHSIEQRIESINKTFDVGNYILGPICTTALICFLLPRVNKFVTHIQDKPNSETVEMTLSSKIRIAELQQKIAELDAQKKLAEKKEEREIEEGIKQTKYDNMSLQSEITSLNNTIRSLTKKKTESDIQIEKLNSNVILLKEDVSKINKDLKNAEETTLHYKSKNNDLSIEMNSLRSDMKSIIVSLNNSADKEEKLRETLRQVDNQLIKEREKQLQWVQTYKGYFKEIQSGDHKAVQITESLISDYNDKYKLQYYKPQ